MLGKHGFQMIQINSLSLTIDILFCEHLGTIMLHNARWMLSWFLKTWINIQYKLSL